MKVTLVLVTGTNCADQRLPDSTSFHSDGERFLITRAPIEIRKESECIDVDLLWIRPPDTEEREAGPPAPPDPQMELSSRGSGQHTFSLKVGAWPAFDFFCTLDDTDALLLVVRHWVSRPSRITGLDWYVHMVNSGLKVQAKNYLGESPSNFAFSARPQMFLAGLRSRYESRLVTTSGLKIGWLLEEVLRSLSGELRTTTSAPAHETVGEEPATSTTVPDPRATANEDRRLVVWIYSDSGGEADSAKLAVGLPGQDSSQLLIIPWSEQQSSRRFDGSVQITEAVGVRRGDLVLAHGFDGKADLRQTLEGAGVEVVDYSPSEASWQRCMGIPLRSCTTAEEVRRLLIAYALHTEQRRPVDLLRRILHRAVNRLAPLRIDIAVLGELAKERDHLGISDQLLEMKAMWEIRPESRPLSCITDLHRMLVGRVGGLPGSQVGAGLPLTTLKTADVLCERFFDKSPDRSCGMLKSLIDISGLYKTESVYALREASSVVRYLRALERAVLETDTSEKIVGLANSLMESARDDHPDLVAVSLGIAGFSYAAWLDEVCSLLEMLLEMEERAEGEA